MVPIGNYWISLMKHGEQNKYKATDHQIQDLGIQLQFQGVFTRICMRMELFQIHISNKTVFCSNGFHIVLGYTVRRFWWMQLKKEGAHDFIFEGLTMERTFI